MRRVKQILLGFGAAAAASGLAIAQNANTGNGVYTGEQATIGQTTYQTVCAKCHQADLPDQKECAVCRPRDRGRKLSAALIHRRHVQAQRRQPRRLPRRNPHGYHRRSPTKPDRRPHALAIPKSVNPKSLGDHQSAYA